MTRLLKLISLGAFTCFILVAFAKPVETTNVKCMIQMINYTGEGAYVVISLIDPEGNYEQTLYVQGTDSEWYSEIPEWWKFYGKRRLEIDAISGATVGGGGRSVNMVKIPSDKIDAGYSIRFETAVEDQEYYADDVQFTLTTESVNSKVNGKGFIRYVRMMQQ
tara:strand:- start:304 stop:792 length:489 start_codon:yes stop_codon:yes gene_type:complete